MAFLHVVTMSSSYSTMYQMIGDDRLSYFAIKIEKHLNLHMIPAQGPQYAAILFKNWLVLGCKDFNLD